MIPSAKGRSLELYFIDGKPDGMLTAEVFNWTGHVLMTPRTQIVEALRRKEAVHTGVYLLLGEDEDGTPLLYIGEAEDVSERIRSHASKKDWWNSAILITSTANNLNKAHVKYLESRLVEEARAVGRIALENGNTPTRSSLSEAAQANMEAFLEYIFMVLPALRIDAFIKNTRPSQPAEAAGTAARQATVFELYSPKHNLRATAILNENEMIVQAGSQARWQWEGAGTEDSGYAHRHAELVRMGILQDAGDHRVFTQNYAFTSASASAAVIMGRNTNGPKHWKVQGTSITYKDWEAARLADSQSGESL